MSEEFIMHSYGNKEKYTSSEILFMNKDSIVATGLLAQRDDAVQLTEVKGKLPLGLKLPTSWIENRKASSHNHQLLDLMIQCGCDTLSGFIDFTHAASLNDTFWVKRADDDAEWNDISLYRNDFNETISNASFYGSGMSVIDLSSPSPELVMDGSFPKCVKRETDGIYLYKRGLGAYGQRQAGTLWGSADRRDRFKNMRRLCPL